MSVRLKRRTREQEAEEIVNANLKPMMEEILRNVGGRMRAARKPLNRQDLEIAYNEGWHALTEHIIKGRPLTSLDGLLFTMVHRRAMDIYRAKQEGRRVEMDLEAQPVDAEIVEQIEDQEMLTQLLGRLKDRLNEKERRGVTLCVLHGYTRPEAADLLGIDRVKFERVMDGASKKMSGIVASLEARGCGGDEWSRMMRAYALGLLSEDDRDYHRAVAHVDGPDACEACRRYVRGLRGMAAVLPPLLPPGLLGAPHDTASVLSHLTRWLGGGGHAAAVRAGAAGMGAGGAGASSGGGTAVGVAAGGGTKTLLLAGAAALSIAGATAIAIKHVGRSSSHHSAHAAAPAPVGAINQAEALASPRTFLTEPARHAARLGRRTPTVHRQGHKAAPFASDPPAVTKESPEFTLEQPPADHTSAATSTTPAPAPAEATNHSSSPSHGGEEGSEFGFEK